MAWYHLSFTAFCTKNNYIKVVKGIERVIVVALPCLQYRVYAHRLTHKHHIANPAQENCSKSHRKHFVQKKLQNVLPNICRNSLVFAHTLRSGKVIGIRQKILPQKLFRHQKIKHTFAENFEVWRQI